MITKELSEKKSIMGKERTRYFLLDLLIISVLLKTGFPYAKYVFYPILIFSFFYTIFYIKFDLSKIYLSLRSLSIIIIQVVIYIFALVFNCFIPMDVIKEGINIFCVLIIGFILTNLLKSRGDFDAYLKRFNLIFLYLPLMLSILGIVKLGLELKGVDLPLYFNSVYPFGTSLIPDNNFFSLTGVLGIVYIIYYRLYGKTKLSNFFLMTALLIFVLGILLGGSRRANISLIVIIIAVFILLIQAQIKFVNFIPVQIRKTLTLSFFLSLLALVFIPITLFFLILSIKPETKIKISESLGLRLSKCQYFSTTILLRFNEFNGKNDYDGLFSKLWQGHFNPKFPGSGWGNGDYLKVKDLNNIGLSGLPTDAIGIRLDNHSNSNFWRGSSYYCSNLIHKYMKSDNRYMISINCYISKDYDGNSVYLSADQKSLAGKGYAGYNLKEKGTWQKLKLNFPGDNSFVTSIVTVVKDRSINLSSLKGYVIFAYPTIDSVRFNPENPSTWATLPYREIYPLTGERVNIVPKDTRGCLLDSSTTFSIESSASNQYAYSFIAIGDSFVNIGDKVKAGVFCYVSPEFNGSIVSLLALNGSRATSYDLFQKGKWQKLDLDIEGDNNRLPIYLYFAKYGVTDYSSLRGNIIFAYPSYSIFHSDKLTVLNHLSLKSTSHTYSSASILTFLPWDYWMSGQTNWASVNGVPPQDEFSHELSKDVFTGSRLDRWKFALRLFKNEYSLKQKIIGNGFHYMKRFGAEFFGDEKRLDWPHNPFISVTLYSGIIGLIIYLWFFLKTIKLYLRYLSDYLLPFICFIIVFFFSFFSANNPLEPLIFGFFSIFPFIIDDITKRIET